MLAPTFVLPVSGTAPDELTTKEMLEAAVKAVVDPLHANTETKAPLASPALTGAPTAPTPAPATNSTRLATTAFVQALLLALSGGTPVDLDTMGKMAAAINNDPDFATTINSAIDAKAALEGPAFTGTPTAPTPAPATNSTRLATTAFVQALVATLVNSSPATLDSFNELAAALGDDPNFATTIFSALSGKASLAQGAKADSALQDAAAFATAAQGGKADALRAELVLDTVDRSGWPFAVIDETTKRMALSVDRAGHVWIGGADVTDFFQNEAGLAVLLSALEQAASRSGYSLAFIDDLGRIGFGLNGAGHVIIDGIDVTELLRTDIAGQFAAVSAALTSNNNIWCLGDSLTEGAGASAYDKTYPWVLAGLLQAGQTVLNAGIGGQVSAQIAARAGGKAILIDLSGGEIPASASAIVTTINNAFLTTPATTAERVVTGWLDGVYGTLTKDVSDTYSFVRDVSAVDPHALPAEAVFELDTSTLPDQTAIIWAGRNDNLIANSDAVFDSVVASVDALRPVNPRFVILSVLNADDEPIGSADYDALMAFNRRLKIKYPHNYLDVRAALIQAHNSGLPSDVTDAANDIPPGSLRSDKVHLNDTGYALIAQAVKDFLDNKGW